MQAVMENLQKKSLGGNDLIDVDLALGHEFPPLTSSYTERDGRFTFRSLPSGAVEVLDDRPRDARGCPGVGATSGTVWGTHTYTDDSSLAAAAVHAGVLEPGQAGFDRLVEVAALIEVQLRQIEVALGKRGVQFDRSPVCGLLGRAVAELLVDLALRELPSDSAKRVLERHIEVCVSDTGESMRHQDMRRAKRRRTTSLDGFPIMVASLDLGLWAACG